MIQATFMRRVLVWVASGFLGMQCWASGNIYADSVFCPTPGNLGTAYIGWTTSGESEPINMFVTQYDLSFAVVAGPTLAGGGITGSHTAGYIQSTYYYYVFTIFSENNGTYGSGKWLDDVWIFCSAGRRATADKMLLGTIIGGDVKVTKQIDKANYAFGDEVLLGARAAGTARIKHLALPSNTPISSALSFPPTTRNGRRRSAH